MSDAMVAVNGVHTPTAEKPVTLASPNIVISKKVTQHHVEIDMDKLTWRDAKAMNEYRAKVAAGEMTNDEAMAISEDIIKKVTGWDNLDDQPVELVNKVMTYVFSQDDQARADQGN